MSAFAWKDYRDHNESKTMTLDADEFIRRFLLHVLPDGFHRIRHFGFLANACCVEKLARIRSALDVPNPEPRVKPKDYRERYALLTGKRPDICPFAAVAWSTWIHGRPVRPHVQSHGVTAHDAKLANHVFASDRVDMRRPSVPRRQARDC